MKPLRDDPATPIERRARDLLLSGAWFTLPPDGAQRIGARLARTRAARPRWWKMPTLLAVAAVVTGFALILKRPTPPPSVEPVATNDVVRTSPTPAPPRFAAPQPSPVSSPSSGALAFRADHEGGTLDEWRLPSDVGSSRPADKPHGEVAITSDEAHSGRHSVRLTVRQTQRTYARAALLREGPLREPTHFSAWFFVPQPAHPHVYWVIFKLASRTDASDRSTELNLWDVLLTRRPDASWGLHLFHHGGRTPPLATDAPAVPFGRWFHVEVLFSPDPEHGRIALWLDGTLVHDLSDVPTAPTDWVTWMVANSAAGFVEPEVTIYMDDAAMSRERLGARATLPR